MKCPHCRVEFHAQWANAQWPNAAFVPSPGEKANVSVTPPLPMASVDQQPFELSS